MKDITIFVKLYIQDQRISGQNSKYTSDIPASSISDVVPCVVF